MGTYGNLLAICIVIIAAVSSVQCFSPKKDESEKESGDDIFSRILKANSEVAGVQHADNKDASEDFFEGDIKKWKEFEADLKAMQKGVAFEAQKVGKWPNGRVPYTFASGTSSTLQQAVSEGIDEFNAKTCVRFVKRSTESDYVQFIQGSGCWSYIGRQGGEQQISLGSGCQKKGVAVHEMMHSVGFWHEHSRIDRDKYISVVMANVQPGYDNNFLKYQPNTATTYGLAYDKFSVMHYGNYAFSKNGQKTIISLSDSNEELGQRNGMTDLDAQGIRLHYNCDNTGTGTTTAPATTEPATTEPAKTEPAKTEPAKTEPATNAPVTIAPPTECKDEQPFCHEISRRWCKQNQWMQENCRDKCQLCPPKCEDKAVYCWWWAKYYCNSSRYSRFMQKNCKRSCKHCDD